MLAEVAKTPSTHAIFVDAGYVYAAAGLLVATIVPAVTLRTQLVPFSLRQPSTYPLE